MRDGRVQSDLPVDQDAVADLTPAPLARLAEGVA